MQIHSVQEQTIQGQIEKLMKQQVKREIPVPFSDPIREFAKASQVEGMVRNWLTYPIEERKRLVKNSFAFIPRFMGDERDGRAPETEDAYNRRIQERWRALCVIIQEESRALPGNRAPEVAIGALKHLFPDYDWKAKPAETPPVK
jgi:hypothetical protein